jgi:ankyrin repeat protein
MNLLNFQRVLFAFWFIALRCGAFVVGDYVDYSDPNNNYKEFGTVMAIARDGALVVRPHGTMQGDFRIVEGKVTLVRSAQDIENAKPKDDEYSINLMWVNRSFSDSEFLFQKSDVEDYLAKIAGWVKLNPNSTLHVWYDSAMSDTQAPKNTFDKLSKDYPEEAGHIVFSDLRQFPEVKNDPKGVFWDKTPVYFRVDLYRVVAAYNVLKEATEQNRRHYFAYADIDVTPMSKAELFDNATQMDMDIFGIVMARGGLNNLRFENSFQMWTNKKPNLLKAAKAAIIDTSIARAENILRGNNWAYSRDGDTKPLEQTVYSSYDSMFWYFYQLEGWGGAELNRRSIPNELNKENAADYFGLITINNIEYKNANPNLFSVDISFTTEGIQSFEQTLYIPRKIIAAPASRFGGQPTKPNPAEINPRNFNDILDESLEKKPFDGRLLFIAVANNNEAAVRAIAEKLSPEDLAAIASKPVSVAFKKNLSNVLKILLDKLNSDERLLGEIAQTVTNEKFLGRAIIYMGAQSLKTIFDAFASHPSLRKQMALGLAKENNDGKPLLEAIAHNRVDIIQTIYDEYANDDELFRLLVDSLVGSSGDMEKILRAKPNTLSLLRQTFLKDKKDRKEALYLENRAGITAFFEAMDRGKVEQIKAFAADILQDHEVIERLSFELNKKDRFGQNPLHDAANGNKIENIEFIEELFAKRFAGAIKEALSSTNRDGKKPIDLAEEEDVKQALRRLEEVANNKTAL